MIKTITNGGGIDRLYVAKANLKKGDMVSIDTTGKVSPATGTSTSIFGVALKECKANEEVAIAVNVPGVEWEASISSEADAIAGNMFKVGENAQTLAKTTSGAVFIATGVSAKNKVRGYFKDLI